MPSSPSGLPSRRARSAGVRSDRLVIVPPRTPYQIRRIPAVLPSGLPYLAGVGNDEQQTTMRRSDQNLNHRPTERMKNRLSIHPSYDQAMPQTGGSSRMVARGADGKIAPIEAFRTPASVPPLTPAYGRHPKTLNVSGRSLEKRSYRPPSDTRSDNNSD